MRICLILVLAVIFPVMPRAQFLFTDSAVTCRLATDIRVLAADTMLGREAGTDGERKASAYIVNRLKEAGIHPWKDSSYLLPFRYCITQFTAKSVLQAGNTEFQWQQDFGACGISGSDSVTGPLVVPDGNPASEDSHPFTGKIVLIDLSAAENQTRRPMNPETLPYTLASRAREQGATAVIFHHGSRKTLRSVFTFNRPDWVDIPVMYVNNPTARNLLGRVGETLCMIVRLQRSFQTYRNIAGYLDNGAASTIIFGAHYDHLGMRNRSSDSGAWCVGADDNASGTAGVLEMGRFFASNPDRGHNYLLLLFSAEEKGLLGSEQFVKEMSPAFHDSIRFMFNLDMIGRLGCEGMQVTAEGTGSSPAWKKLYRTVRHPGFSLKKTYASLPFSDQHPFYISGIPVLYLTTGTHPQYHTPADRPETINYTGTAGIIGYAERLTMEASGMKEVPWNKISGFTQAMSIAGFVIDYLGSQMAF